ncbi:hypothetical protein SGGMMB4_03332 [Sodalis glossinidius str. 'morsitans']|uniref:LysR substrate binding domain protein n=1 Tax=Sodalis glossinidius (strain morsitans) TaxID=343509 RepID=A0A193QK09_SODGM|nr:hypothetical protein [Sodalis glossinidius]CRL45534.1 hypothetical protein SGGMMB4_03332 [Sodalis glossinidius str. 'morsitans']
MAEPWQFHIDGRWVTLPVSGNLTVDDRTRLLAAAVAGVGVVLVTEEMVQTALRKAVFVVCLPAAKRHSRATIYAGHREKVSWSPIPSR